MTRYLRREPKHTLKTVDTKAATKSRGHQNGQPNSGPKRGYQWDRASFKGCLLSSPFSVVLNRVDGTYLPVAVCISSFGILEKLFSRGDRCTCPGHPPLFGCRHGQSKTAPVRTGRKKVVVFCGWKTCDIVVRWYLV